MVVLIVQRSLLMPVDSQANKASRQISRMYRFKLTYVIIDMNAVGSHAISYVLFQFVSVSESKSIRAEIPLTFCEQSCFLQKVLASVVCITNAFTLKTMPK
jgi:hypothetical protein